MMRLAVQPCGREYFGYYLSVLYPLLPIHLGVSGGLTSESESESESGVWSLNLVGEMSFTCHLAHQRQDTK